MFQYPKPEPPPAPENPEPPRGFGKVKAKFAAWRAERKRKKAEEKARKKAAAAAAKEQARPAPQKGKDHAGDPLHHAQGCGQVDQSSVRSPAHHKNTGAPWRARGGPRRRGPRATASCRRGCTRCWASWTAFLWLQFDELRILPDFGSGQPTVEDRVSCRVSAQALFIVLAALRVLYEFWRKKYWTSSCKMWYTI